ncbi:MAG TPA: tyrosine-type recombinase/integrase [Kofleriaceae bacterium]|jgi:integrase
MTPLSDSLAEYLDLRRRAGFSLERTGEELRKFVKFMQEHRARRITVPLAIEWATLSKGSQPAWWSDRLRMVRGFATYCSALDVKTEIPPPRALPRRYKRRTPTLHTYNELRRILRASLRLASPVGLRRHTFSTIIGLLAATGMRPGEPVKLLNADVDLDNGTILIRNSKGRTRIVAVHPSTSSALASYRRHRDRLVVRHDDTFFVGDSGHRVPLGTLERNYAMICRDVGVTRAVGSGPRLHDLRHRFAVRTIEQWYRARAPVMARMELLAAYLGHTHPDHTYWYLSATPELLRLASNMRGRS